jgi:hypothetical protein
MRVLITGATGMVERVFCMVPFSPEVDEVLPRFAETFRIRTPETFRIHTV